MFADDMQIPPEACSRVAQESIVLTAVRCLPPSPCFPQYSTCATLTPTMKASCAESPSRRHGMLPAAELPSRQRAQRSSFIRQKRRFAVQVHRFRRHYGAPRVSAARGWHAAPVHVCCRNQANVSQGKDMSRCAYALQCHGARHEVESMVSRGRQTPYSQVRRWGYEF